MRSSRICAKSRFASHVTIAKDMFQARLIQTGSRTTWDQIACALLCFVHLDAEDIASLVVGISHDVAVAVADYGQAVQLVVLVIYVG